MAQKLFILVAQRIIILMPVANINTKAKKIKEEKDRKRKKKERRKRRKEREKERESQYNAYSQGCMVIIEEKEW